MSAPTRTRYFSGTPTYHETCQGCGKRIYRSRKQAMRALDEFQNDIAKRCSGKMPQRVYRCDKVFRRLGYWHLTSMAEPPAQTMPAARP